MVPSFDDSASAFTLIELLVVVLIIGILATVALPQYRVAVGKAKYTQGMVDANALATGVEMYRLANGTWPDNLEDLDISTTNSCDHWINRPNTSTEIFAIVCRTTGIIYRVDMYTNGSKIRTCECSEEDSLKNKICQNATGKSTPDSQYGGHNYYSF